MIKKLDIFISHASQDKTIAKRLKTLLEHLFLNRHDIFLSSDLPGGTEWFDAIEDFLKKSPLMLVIVTKNSRERPWVLFEAGAGWRAGSDLIPVKATDIRQLPHPLRKWTARRLDLKGLTDLCVEIGTKCGDNVPRNQARNTVKAVFPRLKR